MSSKPKATKARGHRSGRVYFIEATGGRIPGDRMFMSDLGGSVYTASPDGAARKMLLAVQGNLTGVAYVD